MWPDQVSKSGPLVLESDALPTAHAAELFAIGGYLKISVFEKI